MTNDPEVIKTAREIIADGFKSADIKSDEPFKVLKEILTAKRSFCDKHGNVYEEQDRPTQLKGVQLCMELNGLLIKKVEEAKASTITHKMAPEDIDRLEAIAKELRGLESRLVSEPIQQGVIIDVVATDKRVNV